MRQLLELVCAGVDCDQSGIGWPATAAGRQGERCQRQVAAVGRTGCRLREKRRRS